MAAPKTTREVLLSLPEPLRRPPPRDLSYVSAELTRERQRFRGGVVAVAAFPVLLLTLIWFQAGTLLPWWRTALICLGLTALASTALVRQWWRLRQSTALFRDGMATVGVLRSVFASLGTGELVAVSLVVDFTDALGVSRVADLRAVCGGKMDVKQGEKVPMLVHARFPHRVAAYTPGLGLAPGTVRG